MTTKNQHVSDYLDQYIDKIAKPEFAVLLKGKWGVGKTWFIEEYFSERLRNASGDYIETEDKEKKNYLYVSLYGIKTTAAIDDELFKQIHPILGSKGMQLAASVLKSTLKFSMNLDLDRDGKSDGSISLGMPSNEWLLSTTKRASKLVIVFDDLERSSMDLGELLGYINKFVEHAGGKVILLANQEDIEADTNNINSRYTKTKEKLIGKEFEIAPNVEMAVKHFSKALSSQTQKRVSKWRDLIIRIYEQSGHNNLRRVRQGLLDFDRVCTMLDDDILENEDFYKQFLSIFCVLSHEIGTGNLSSAEIQMLSQWHMFRRTDDRPIDDDKRRYVAIGDKYVGTDITALILTPTLWGSILSAGVVHREAMHTEIRSSVYFLSSEQPHWARLWHFFDLSAEDFEELAPIVEEELKAGKYDHPEIVRHVAGTLINLAQEKYITTSTQDIVSIAKTHLDNLQERDLINLRGDDHFQSWRDTGWANLGFHAIESTEFAEITRHLDAIRSVVKRKRDIQEGKALLRRMKSDLSQFTIDLSIGRDGSGKFATNPIFLLIPEDDFFATWLELNTRDRRYVGYVMRERYRYLNVFPEGVKESPWLKSLSTIFKNAASKQSTNFRRASYTSFVDEIQLALEGIEEFKLSHPNMI